ncbi:MAG: sulfatase-like hydrolase/transferase [Betaproteobacteria bacterium]|nr:sulfatase-like hydrolase/transferase [Betaproteobacteria bacterium]
MNPAAILRACRHSPFYLPLLALWLVRLAVLGMVCLADAAAPGEALAGLLVHAVYYLAESLFLLALCEGLRRLRPPGWVWGPATVLLLFGVMLLSLIDPILYQIIGDRLSPSVLRQFVGWQLFVDSDFWQPVIANRLPAGLGALTVAVFLFWVSRHVFHGARAAGPLARRHVLAVAAAGLAGMLGAVAVAAIPLLEPVEVLFLREWSGLDALDYSAAERRARVAQLRAWLGLPNGARWKDERYPLVYEFTAPGAPVADPPDVFVFVVESLRGENFAPANPSGPRLAHTPHMTALAARGAAFTHYLSNGFPSGPGYIAITHSAWPHLRKRIVAEFTQTPLDGIARRLGSLGYRTLHVEASPGFDKQENWVRAFDVSLWLDQPDERSADVRLADQTLDWLRRWDAEPKPPPLFTLYLTKDPHLPYRYPDADGKTLTFGPVLEENYLKSLHYVDAQLGRLFAYLEQRPRARNTVIVITGDHANFLDQQQTRAFPVNDTVWSGAVIAGPERLIGPPRVEHSVASQVDLLPTLSALAGDRRPSAALGRDLLHDDGRPRDRALAIRSGGLRYQTGQGGILADPALPRGAMPAEALPASPGHERAPALSAGQVHALVSTWSYLLERGEVWNPAFLASATSGK